MFRHAPIPQPPEYNDFADKRDWLGIPNFLDVASNVFFLWTGIGGLVFLADRRKTAVAFANPAERAPYFVFFLGVLGTTSGKSITGALLGGYAAVEIARHFLNYTGVTGDWFAVIAPVGILLGRVGCVLHGCCPGYVCAAGWFTVNDAAGVARWPAAWVELIFNALALGVILLLRASPGALASSRRVSEPSSPQYAGETPALRGSAPSPNYLLPGQHFHLYLMAYGAFRFAHEFLRATPRIVGPLSGYQVAALALIGLGAVGFVARRRMNVNIAGFDAR